MAERISPPAMAGPSGAVVTVNGGSSSIKFAVYESANGRPRRVLSGEVQRVGQDGSSFAARDAEGRRIENRPIDASDHHAAGDLLIEWIRGRVAGSIAGVGHRVVHGGPRLLEHQRITPAVLDELRRTQPIDLAHLPREIALVETFTRQMPDVPQFACFDTAFHRDLPRLAQLLPIPRKYDRAGVRRFGFHGLSYTYLMGELRRVAGDAAADGRVILAHLGNGASMAAVRGGHPIETTMAFTPTAGLVMGTRPGDLDPAAVTYLMREEGLSADDADEFLNRQCGMLGVSETSSDWRDLLARRSTDVRAAEAVDLFCYRARQWVGALAASLGGVDTLVFSGGIGEHSPEARAGICEGLGFLGIQIDSARNAGGESLISTDGSRVTVRVIPTDEEAVIAETVVRLLARP